MERLQAGVANTGRLGVRNRRRFSEHRAGMWDVNAGSFSGRITLSLYTTEKRRFGYCLNLKILNSFRDFKVSYGWPLTLQLS